MIQNCLWCQNKVKEGCKNCRVCLPSHRSFTCCQHHRLLFLKLSGKFEMAFFSILSCRRISLIKKGNFLKIIDLYSFDLMAYPGEEVVFQPISAGHLFEPESLHVFVVRLIN
jgi:hypothetical protein